MDKKIVIDHIKKLKIQIEHKKFQRELKLKYFRKQDKIDLENQIKIETIRILNEERKITDYSYELQELIILDLEILSINQWIGILKIQFINQNNIS